MKQCVDRADSLQQRSSRDMVQNTRHIIIAGVSVIGFLFSFVVIRALNRRTKFASSGGVESSGAESLLSASDDSGTPFGTVLRAADEDSDMSFLNRPRATTALRMPRLIRAPAAAPTFVNGFMPPASAAPAAGFAAHRAHRAVVV